MPRHIIYIIYIALLALLCSCSRLPTDPSLLGIAETVGSAPDEAIAALDSMDRSRLSDRNRRFHDLLSLKARDKAYIVHTSDSTILALLDYYKGEPAIYPEVLYYAGRVYSDLGDYPSALQYFHAALDLIPSTPDHYALRGSVLSQTSLLLNKLRLYDEAVPYVENAIEINKACNDTINIVFGFQLLGGIYLRSNNLNRADSCFLVALSYSENLPKTHSAKSKMFRAGVMHKKGCIDSALCLIRGTYNDVVPIVRNSVLAYSSKIYHSAGIWDTAYLCSYELIHSSDPTNRVIGYDIILSPELQSYSTPDSLTQYFQNYRAILENFYNENQNHAAINEQNLYNYQLHEREKEKAQTHANSLRRYVFGFIVLAILLSSIALYQKIQNKNRIIELQQAIDNINRLKQQLKDATHKNTMLEELVPKPTKATTENLRERLKNELMALYEQTRERPSAAESILQSDVYHKLQDYAESDKIITETDPLWNEIEQTVLAASPEFKNNLNLLTAGKLTLPDYQTALLIKCGMRPSQLTKLLGRSNGAIISRRTNLCIKLLDEKLDVKAIDSIILSL